ncbi:Nucleotide-binding universal stress protein, UspA family [Geodermatophilus siccatus]|uniref:Nucleotide-binding universal stress protein, UspA family n=1 Tax=Geodermatophilus siccatus TaxID=1137991 RepID=A0A1G9VRG6_9ACTN|nr:universal stress protein [Geodermatophilus siccatus]SDM74571.1 Nucleotide-binding universal stress protein, UspA family [Geodermatophilus siccatus]
MTQRADRVREVVVGVDGSDEARRALAWGFREAGLREVAVRVLTVWTGSPPSGAGEGSRPTAEFEREVGARVRADAVEAARATGTAAVPFETQVRYGHPAESLIEGAGADGLLVVGQRGLGGLRGQLFGSVSQQCAQYATGPVVVVRGDRPVEGAAPAGRVVVGVDGSPDSVTAARFAAAEARARGAELHVVHAWSDTVSGYGGPPWAVPGATLQEEAASALRRSVQDAGLDGGPGLRVRAEAVEGIDWDVLLDVAEGADLLVVGSRGRSGWAALLLGSVALHCVTAAPCPVAVVGPPRDRR